MWKRSTNPDMRVASTYWLYMTLRRLERDAEAAQALASITADMDIIENTAYHRLLLLNKGVLSEADFGSSGDALQDASAGYGLGNWHFYNGRVGKPGPARSGVVCWRAAIGRRLGISQPRRRWCGCARRGRT